MKLFCQNTGDGGGGGQVGKKENKDSVLFPLFKTLLARWFNLPSFHFCSNRQHNICEATYTDKSLMYCKFPLAWSEKHVIDLKEDLSKFVALSYNFLCYIFKIFCNACNCMYSPP